jgi:CheY-like chemotaxis protein/signal transduction histidine kinase
MHADAVIWVVAIAAGALAATLFWGLGSRLRARRRVTPAPAPRVAGPAPHADGDGEGARLERERAELDERTVRAERAEQLRNLLVSKMSHDIRTPLNSVITLSQLLCEGTAGTLSYEQRKYVEIIQRSGQTLLSLINDILDIASLEAGRLEVDSGPVDVRALAKGVADAMDPVAQKKGLPLHLNLPRRTVLARADEERLRHALGALVEHAIGETRNGYVEISVEASDRQALIRIADTSAGLSREAHNALYDDFLAGVGPFTGRPTPPLSLVVAGRLLKLMGEITVDSVAGEGTTFAIALPRSTEDAAARPSDGEPAAAGAVSGRVLLVEDDEIERRRVGSILEAAGYDVTLASSGQEGLSLMRAGQYDAVVLDLVMPGMSGLDVLRSVRADERLTGTPFIVLSALYMTKGERAVLGPGVSSVVRKGDSTAEELTAQLRRAIASRGVVPASDRAATSAVGRRARVLVVEDNVDNLFTIKQVLASLPVTIETAASGPEALEICRQQAPDLIMMDVELPGMSGLDASRAIHALPDCGRIPIIAITADAMSGDRERVLDAQCSDYLAKPVQPLDVVTAVTRALQLETH